jgi:hypothetical protein
MVWISIGLLVGLVVVLILLLRRPLVASWRAAEETRARKDWEIHRERLREEYFRLASGQGKPRGLRWVKCEWVGEERFMRLPENNLLTALVSVNLYFEAIEGGDMEFVEAVGTVRDATAIFHYVNNSWGTGGRTLFNMNAEEAERRLIPDPESYPSPFFNDP